MIKTIRFSSFIFNKLKLFWQKPKLIILMNDDRDLVRKSLAKILKSSLKVKKEILFVEDIEKVKLSPEEYLVFNFDKNNVKKLKEVKEKIVLRFLNYGFQEGANLRASDLRLNDNTNFKINYQGKIVPIWLKGALEKEQIYPVLAAVAAAVVLGLNLVEISQSLKES